MVLSDFQSGMLIGGLIGLVAGVGLRWFVDRMQKRNIPPAEREKRTRAVLLWLAVLAAFAVNIGSASLAYSASGDTEALARDTATRDACSTHVMRDFLEAIEERNSLTDAAAEANESRLRQQLTFLRAAQAQQDTTTSFQAYVDGLERYLRITDEQAQTRREFPYPTVEQIEACLP